MVSRRRPLKSLFTYVCLSLPGRKILSAYFLISRGVPAGARGLRLLTHRFPTRIWGRLGLFPCFTPSHTPFRTLPGHPTTSAIWSEGEKKIRKIVFSGKKMETLRGTRSPTSAWHMGFVRERGLTLWVWGARSVSNPYFFCTVYICQGTTLINYQLQTLGYQ